MIETRQDKTIRKFKEIDFYDKQETNQYFLLPFRFHRLNNEKEVLVNEVGDHLVVPNGTTHAIVTKTLSKETNPDLYGDLIAGFSFLKMLFHLLLMFLLLDTELKNHSLKDLRLYIFS